MSACPKCHKELLLFEYKGIDLLKCPNCEGFWFQKGKFSEVKQLGFSDLSTSVPSENASEHASSPTPALQEIQCPDCVVALLPYAYAYSSDVRLHRCTHCHGIWVNSADLLRIEQLLSGYKESLDEAKARVLPLMLKVKKQIRQEERAKEEEQKGRKKGLFNRFFRQKESRNRKIQDIFQDSDDDRDDTRE